MSAAAVLVKATQLAIALALPVLVLVVLHHYGQGVGRTWVPIWLVLTLLWNALLIALALKGRFPR
ncbi:MAG: hypothetical protein QXP81_05490 [Nitrososphaerota archaeon]